MEKGLIALLVLAACLALVGAVDNTKCDASVIQCLKKVNGGRSPLTLLDGLEVILNQDYSIVWYSKHLVEELSLTCINTRFCVFGNTDTYWSGCSNKQDITFKTHLNPFTKIFTISEYQGMTLQAHAAEANGCLALYVCSPTGVTGSHVTIYCPTKKLSSLSADIEEAKAKLTACGINDGTALCSESCT